jgi:hypothetical protein
VSGNYHVQRFNAVEEIHLCDALYENDRKRASISANLASLVSRWSWGRAGSRTGCLPAWR